MTHIILDHPAVLPPALARELDALALSAPLYQLSKLRPSPCLVDVECRELIPSMLHLAARQCRAAGIPGPAQGERPWVFLEVDPQRPHCLELARKTLRFAAPYSNQYHGVVGVWLQVGEVFHQPDWTQAAALLKSLSRSATVLLFVPAIHHPAVKELSTFLGSQLGGLKTLPPSRYSVRELAGIICAYLKTMGLHLKEEEAVLTHLTNCLSSSTLSSGKDALLLADIIGRFALPQDGRAVVSVQTISTALKGGAL